MAEYRRAVLGMMVFVVTLIAGPWPAQADTFQQMWMGRIARPPADNVEASVYWEDKWDARGKRFRPNEVSCAHRTEALGTIFIVTNLENGKKIECPVLDRGPFARGRVTSRWVLHSRSVVTGCAASGCVGLGMNKLRWLHLRALCDN